MAELCLKRLLTDGSAEFSGAIRYRRANVEFDLNTHQILQHASKQNQRELAKYRIKNNTIGHKTQNCARSLSNELRNLPSLRVGHPVEEMIPLRYHFPHATSSASILRNFCKEIKSHTISISVKGTEKKEFKRDSTVKVDSKSRTICSQALFRWGKHQLPSFFSDLGTFGKGLKQIIHNIIHSGVTFLRSDLSQSKLPRTSNIRSRMPSIKGSVLKEFEIHSSVARNETFKWALNSKHLPFPPSIRISVHALVFIFLKFFIRLNSKRKS